MFPGDIDLFDRDRWRHHARKEGVQRATIIGVVSALMMRGCLAVGVVMVDVSSGCRLRRAGERRRNHPRELGYQKEGHQRADKAFYRP